MRKIWMACLMAFTLMGCTKELEDPVRPEGENLPEANLVDFEFTATPDTPESKTVNGGLSTTWANDDKIKLYSTYMANSDKGYPYCHNGKTEEDGSKNPFTTEGNGVFKGKLGEVLFNKSLDWLFLYGYFHNLSRPRPNVDFPIEVTQDGDNSKAHLIGQACPLYAFVDDTKADVFCTNPVTMNNMASVMAVTVTNNSGAALELNSVALIAPMGITGTYFVGHDATDKTFSEDGLLLKENGTAHNMKVTCKLKAPLTLPDKASATVYLPFKPFTVTRNQDLKLSVNGYVKTINVDYTFKAGVIKPVNFNYDKADEGPANNWNGKFPDDGRQLEGKGDGAVPLLIKSAADFAFVVNSINNNKPIPNTNNRGNSEICFKLMTDIDFEGQHFPAIKEHNALFDGNGHTLSNVAIDSPAAADVKASGLFAVAGANEVIKNLTLDNVTVTAIGKENAGALIGKAAGVKLLLENVIVKNSTVGGSAAGYAGGLVGCLVEYKAGNDIFLKNCHVYGGTVKAKNAAGLIGRCRHATILGCSTSNTVEGKNAAGGLIAEGYQTGAMKIDDGIHMAACYTNAKVSITDKANANAGGIACSFNGHLDASYSTAALTSKNTSHDNILFFQNFYLVDAVPTTPLEARVQASYAPSIKAPNAIKWLFYGLKTDARQDNVLPAGTNPYDPTAFDAMKTGINAETVAAMNARINALTAAEYTYIKNYQFVLKTDDPHGFPAVLVNKSATPAN